MLLPQGNRTAFLDRETHIVRPHIHSGFSCASTSRIASWLSLSYRHATRPCTSAHRYTASTRNAYRLTELKDRREELEQKLADEKAKLKRMQADRRASSCESRLNRPDRASPPPNASAAPSA